MWLAGRLPGLAALEISMAEDLWNRVNIPFPGAVSTVRTNFDAKTGIFPSDKAITRHIWTLKFVMLTFSCCLFLPQSTWDWLNCNVCVVVSAAQMSSSETCWRKTRRRSSCTRVKCFRRKFGFCTSSCTSWTTATGTTRHSKRWSRSVRGFHPERCFKTKLKFCSMKNTDLLSGWTMHKQAEDDEDRSCSKGPEGCLSC